MATYCTYFVTTQLEENKPPKVEKTYGISALLALLNGISALLARLKYESTIGSLCIFGLRMPLCGTEVVQVQAQVPLGLPCGTGPSRAHSHKPLVHLSWTYDLCFIQGEP